MRTVLLVLLTFVCGACYESSCVFWVRYSQTHRGRAALFSMLNAIVTIIGVEQFLHGLVFQAACVLGFGTGTYVSVLLTQWLARRRA